MRVVCMGGPLNGEIVERPPTMAVLDAVVSELGVPSTSEIILASPNRSGEYVARREEQEIDAGDTWVARWRPRA